MNDHTVDEASIEASKSSKYLVFKLGDKSFCTKLSHVKEVVSVLEITEVPGLPDYFEGLVNLRGKIITVLDLKKKIGFSKTEVKPKKTCIIVFQVEEVLLGALVDEVDNVVLFSDDEIQVRDAIGSKEKLKTLDGVINRDDKLTFVLNIEKSLDIDVLRSMTEELAA
jgi:purine-binding chemotaxis protein CheW